jgi:flagellin-like hook-associated protein FlgL
MVNMISAQQDYQANSERRIAGPLCTSLPDANIPQVSTQLTQEEILQQAGVSALAQSSTLQQAFLKLLQ